MTADPLGLDRYLRQRMSEFFGPDFANVMLYDWPSLTTSTAPAASPAAGLLAGPSIEEIVPEEAIDVTDVSQPRAVGAATPRRSRRRPIEALRSNSIPLDVYETKENYIVEAEIPGVPKNNISVNVDHNNVLSIDVEPVETILHQCAAAGAGKEGEPVAQKKAPATVQPEGEKPSAEHKKEGEVARLLMERRHEHRRRSIRLPKNADPQKVHTCVESGVLCLSFGKIPPSETGHRIEVK